VEVETQPIEKVLADKPKSEPRGRFIDKWSGRTSKNIVFTQWMAKAKENGINELTFKSRVYKLKYDYQRAATQPRGPQGSRQKRKQNEISNTTG
jgi:chitodextrinase